MGLSGLVGSTCAREYFLIPTELSTWSTTSCAQSNTRFNTVRDYAKGIMDTPDSPCLPSVTSVFCGQHACTRIEISAFCTFQEIPYLCEVVSDVNLDRVEERIRSPCPQSHIWDRNFQRRPWDSMSCCHLSQETVL